MKKTSAEIPCREEGRGGEGDEGGEVGRGRRDEMGRREAEVFSNISEYLWFSSLFFETFRISDPCPRLLFFRTTKNSKPTNFNYGFGHKSKKFFHLPYYTSLP